MLFIKKNYKPFIILLILLVSLIYVTNIIAIPDNVILFENEELNLKQVLGTKIEEVIPVAANITDNKDNKEDEKENNFKSNILETKKYDISLVGIKLKTITTNIIPNKKVIPLGNLVGLKLYTKGVLVVGMSEIKGEDNKIYKPYEEAGINQGDSIIKINGKTINNTDELIECVSKCKGNKINVTYARDEDVLETVITPVKTDNRTYKIGLWVRDTAAGVGTATFYDKNNNSIAALGHGIQDIDTQQLVDVSSGEFSTANVLRVQKGEENNPGKIEGTIDLGVKIGEIYSNTEYGIYGKTTDVSNLQINNKNEVDVASRNEIEIGKASIICTFKDGETKEYEVYIDKIYVNNNENNKSMVVKVTDEKLLENTGGIIQGMSGSPILQNGKLIGALTHVLVSDPTKGYGVFADTMLKQINDN